MSQVFVLLGRPQTQRRWMREAGGGPLSLGNELPVSLERARVVINWGGDTGQASPPVCWILNPREAISRAKNREWMMQALAIHGIPCEGDGRGQPEEDARLPITDGVTGYPIRYRVPVFHLEALGIWEKETNGLLRTFPGISGQVAVAALRDGNGEREIPEERHSRLMRKAMHTAERAVYALGLDFGLVTVAVRSGEPAVAEVEPIPVPAGAMAERFVEAMLRFERECNEALQRTGVPGIGIGRNGAVDTAFGVTASIGETRTPELPATGRFANRERPSLGADPEFLLRRPDGRVVPASRFLGKRGRVGCDAVILPDKRLIHPLVELRPEPVSAPADLVRHLRRALQIASRKITDPALLWQSGGMPAYGFPLGGHVHLGGVWYNAHLLRALDNYLSLPLAYLEGETAKRRRPRFGFLGDGKRKSHGGFEYRTPPSWLVSPGIARGVFALAQLIAMSHWRLRLFPLREQEVQAAYYAGDKERLAPHVRLVWRELSRLPDYADFRKDLSVMERWLREARSWDESADFRAAWKLSPGSASDKNERIPTYPANHDIIDGAY